MLTDNTDDVVLRSLQLIHDCNRMTATYQSSYMAKMTGVTGRSKHTIHHLAESSKMTSKMTSKMKVVISAICRRRSMAVSKCCMYPSVLLTIFNITGHSSLNTHLPSIFPYLYIVYNVRIIAKPGVHHMGSSPFVRLTLCHRAMCSSFAVADCLFHVSIVGLEYASVLRIGTPMLLNVLV